MATEKWGIVIPQRKEFEYQSERLFVYSQHVHAAARAVI